MIRGLIVLVIFVAVIAKLGSIVLPQLRTAFGGLVAGQPSHAPVVCRPNPLAGVYRPARLRVLNSCMTASGRIVFEMHAPDGDIHLSLLPDLGYHHLLNKRNYTRWGGTLVLEIVPADQKTLPTPPLGAHVRVTGAWVNDNDHNWYELHPVWQIVPAQG